MTSSVRAPATRIGRTPLIRFGFSWTLIAVFGSLGLQLYGRLADMPLGHRHYHKALGVPA